MSKKKHRKEIEARPGTGQFGHPPVLRISIILVAVLVAAAYMIRFDSFKKEHPLSFDESVYSILAVQMTNSPGTYNTIAIYEDSLKKGRELPAYFKMPLFKHPPMFPWLIKQSYGIFGVNYYAAFRVSLLAGVLLIALAYFLGSALFGERTGIAAAAIMFIEPVSWIASQKIWMETTLAFFTVLSLCLFARTIRKYDPYFMIASGIAAGLAALCKYPGLLATGIIVIYAVLADRGLFRKRTFIAGLVIPFMMIVPWMVWNYKVYGAELFLANAEITHLISKVGQTLKDYWWAILAAAGAALLYVTIKPRVPEPLIQRSALWKAPVIWALTSIVSLLLLAITWPSLINALNWSHVPEAGWSMGMFAAAPWHFYISRLIEMSPFYILSFAGLVLFAADPVKRKEYLFIYTAVILILGLYMLWGNFQSRYIAAVTVPLVVMAARAMDHILERSARAVKPVRYALIAGLVIFTVCAFAKTLNMDIILAMPNNVCYF